MSVLRKGERLIFVLQKNVEQNFRRDFLRRFSIHEPTCKRKLKKKSSNRSEITDHILSGLGRISFQFSLQKILATSCCFKFTQITGNNYYNSFIFDSVLSVFVYLRQYLSEPLSLPGSAAFVIFSTLEILSVFP